MTRIRPLLLGTALAMIGAAPLCAQQVAYAAVVGGEMDSATQVAVTRTIARARELGIPVEPLVAKVREGRLKRAPGSRIQSAVERLSERLAAARAALGDGSSVDEVIAGADAIAAGADAASLRALRAASARPIAAPIGTLAQLLASGVEQRKAVDMIVVLLRRNAAPAQVLALGNLVEMDVSSGLRPDESAAFRLRGIEGSLSNAGDLNATASPRVPASPPSGMSAPRRRP
ncbi:MAG: hypothetical protein ABJA80_05000 [bacterium]